MFSTLVHLFRDRWVLTSSEQIERGLTLDVPPVRLIAHADVNALHSALREIANETVPVIPQPDWNEPRFKVSLRAQAAGVQSWLMFVRHSRAFFVNETEQGLILEEWPREGGSFSAKASWRETFSPGDLDGVAAYLVANTTPITEPHPPLRARKRQRTPKKPSPPGRKRSAR